MREEPWEKVLYLEIDILHILMKYSPFNVTWGKDIEMPTPSTVSIVKQACMVGVGVG